MSTDKKQKKMEKRGRNTEDSMETEERSTKKNGILVNFTKLGTSILFKDKDGKRTGWVARDKPVKVIMSGKGWLKKKEKDGQESYYLLMQFPAPVKGGAASLLELTDNVAEGCNKVFGETNLHTPFWYDQKKEFMYSEFKLDGSGEIQFTMPPVETKSKKSSLKDRTSSGFYQVCTSIDFFNRIGNKELQHEIEIQVNFMGVNFWRKDTEEELSDYMGLIIKLETANIKRSWAREEGETVPEKIIDF